MQLRCRFGHFAVHKYRCAVLLTQAGDYDMKKCDSEGVVPHPPLHHCSKQYATTKVGQLQGEEVD